MAKNNKRKKGNTTNSTSGSESVDDKRAKTDAVNIRKVSDSIQLFSFNNSIPNSDIYEGISIVL